VIEPKDANAVAIFANDHEPQIKLNTAADDIDNTA
jgi:hypothetical protein